MLKTIWDGFVSRWNINPTLWGRARTTIHTLLFVAALPVILAAAVVAPKLMSSLGYRMHLSAQAGNHYLAKVDELKAEYERLKSEELGLIKQLPPTYSPEGMELVRQIMGLTSRRTEIAQEIRSLLDRVRDS